MDNEKTLEDLSSFWATLKPKLPKEGRRVRPAILDEDDSEFFFLLD